MPCQFTHLRTTPWAPTFTWVANTLAAARQINSFHEDHPRRVGITQDMIWAPFRLWPDPNPWFRSIFSQEIQAIHWFVFKDTLFAGVWRKVRVRVGLHAPPAPELVPNLMFQLSKAYHGKIRDIETLKEWYSDFETIHPFDDGNGRVGGIIVASYAHAMHPEKGWLAAGQ